MNNIRVVILLSRWGYGSPNDVRRLVAEGRVSLDGRPLCDSRALVPHAGAGITVDGAPAERRKTRDDDLRAVERMVADGLPDQSIVKACFARGCSKKQTGRLLRDARSAEQRVAPGGLGTLPSHRQTLRADADSRSPGGRKAPEDRRSSATQRRRSSSSFDHGSQLIDDAEVDELLSSYREDVDEFEDIQEERAPQGRRTEARHRGAVATMLANRMSDEAVLRVCLSFGCSTPYTRHLIEAVRAEGPRRPANRARTAEPSTVDPWEDL
ncbi:MAG: hypothetical protein FJ102_06380 [Deltaproteobacteria bacterium]|nr:hypothetical protein [Deltaproteobacteria bacterium]